MANSISRTAHERLREIFNRSNTLREYSDTVVSLLRDLSGCRCVGLRVLDDEGFIPYVSYVGFSEDFWNEENKISTAKDRCICIRVILESFERVDLPWITSGNAFSCGTLQEFAANLSDDESMLFRGACIRMGFSTVAVIPIKYKDRIIAAFHLADERGDILDSEKLELLKLIANEIGKDLHIIDLEEQQARQASQNAVLLDAFEKLSKASLDCDSVLENIAQLVAELYGDSCSIWLLDKDKTYLDRVAFRAISVEASNVMLAYRNGYRRRADEGLFGYALNKGELLYLSDLTKIKNLISKDYLPIIERYRLQSVLITPLRVGEIIGLITIWRRSLTNPYKFYNEAFLRSLSDGIAQTLQNVQLYQDVQNSQKQMRSLSHRLVNIQENEKRFLARELHDEIGQTLTALKLGINSLKKSFRSSTPTALVNLQECVNELIDRVRNLSLDLRPSMLDDLGLLPALQWYFDRYLTNTKIRVQFDHSGIEELRFSYNIETAAFRIIQEALNNAAKYAEVDHIAVKVDYSDGELTIVVEDNGKGFDIHAVNYFETSGLSGMEERAIFLDGDFAISTSPGAGTSIVVKFRTRPIEME